MTSSTESLFDEAQYRQDVLHLTSPESEEAQAQQLADEARQLGLEVPEIETSALPAASVTSVEFTSPVLSSASSADRYSTCGSVTPSHEITFPAPSTLDQVVSSLSDVALASNQGKPGSTRSLASLSTRPTSFCSSDGKLGLAGHGYTDTTEAKPHRHSMLSVGSADKKEKRRSSIKSAIGRIHFRKKRASSSVPVLPPEAQITQSAGDDGIDRVLLEPKPESNGAADENTAPQASIAQPNSKEQSPPKLEIPIYSKEALQRTLDDPELSAMHMRHRMEKNRHLAFQDAALSTLRGRHQAIVSERQSENQEREEWKREKNIQAIIEIEERQLAVEMEQQREFDRAKVNSRTRIKHMEGYLRNASPPPSPAGTSTRAERSSESFSESDSTPPTRVFTRQHMEQLEQQYHNHESMDQLHNARIKVLRDRQEVKLQEATARMEKELDDMCDRHVQHLAALRSEHEQEEKSLIQALDHKQRTMRQRWRLEEAVLRCHLEMRHGQSYAPLPTISFTNNTDAPQHSPLDSSKTPDTIHPNRVSVAV